MKEFDIYLNQRLTECDIIVYSIPYRDGLTPMNRLILESCIENYVLLKFIAVQSRSELINHIDDMLKTCLERLNLGMEFKTTVSFNVLYTVDTPESALHISANNIKMLANSLIKTENKLQLTASVLRAYIGKSSGRGDSAFKIVQTAEISKNDIEKFSSSSELNAIVERTQKQDFLTVESGADLKSGLKNLCYQITTAIDTSLSIAATVLDTEFHFSFGNGANEIVINAEIGNGSYTTKYLAIQNAVSVLAEVTECIAQYIVLNESGVMLTAEATCLPRRYRLIAEMDENALSFYDAMTLDEVDYINL